MDTYSKNRIKDAIKYAIQDQIESGFADSLVDAIKEYDFSEAIQRNISYVLDQKLGDYIDTYVEDAVCDVLETTLENIFE